MDTAEPVLATEPAEITQPSTTVSTLTATADVQAMDTAEPTVLATEPAEITQPSTTVSTLTVTGDVQAMDTAEPTVLATEPAEITQPSTTVSATLTSDARGEVTATIAMAPTETPATPTTVSIAASAVPPTPVTEQPMATSTPTEAPTELSAVFAYLIATPTAYGTVDVDTGPVCRVADDWYPYEVQQGDTLLAVALAVNSNLIDLREANCFSPVSGIFAGDTILVPTPPEEPVTVPDPVFPLPEQDFVLVGCASPDAQIFAPEPMTELNGIFAIRGSVRLPDGGRYEISLRPAWSNEFHRLLEVDMSLEDNVIGLVNSEIFGPGLQRLRLALVGQDGALVEESICEIPVVFAAP